MDATWTAVSVIADAELADAIGSFLLDCGAPGLECDDTAGVARITAWFEDAAVVDRVRAFVAGLDDSAGSTRPRVDVTTVTDTGWSENWKQHFPPLAVGERLYLHPPWVDAADAPAWRLPILLDPGMAFGTGHHASTRGCLVLLERALRERPNARVLDIGTGSGILAIAAVKLGAREVSAVDIDPDACAVAADNCAINGVAGAITIGPDVDAVSGQFDIVLANLFAHQLVDFAPAIAARLVARGWAIGAGILSAEADAVRDAWRSAGLTDVDAVPEDGWVAIAHRRDA